jgi:hypothetical protein
VRITVLSRTPVERLSIMRNQRPGLIIAAFVVGVVLSGSSPAATEVVVVGTVHELTRNFPRKALDELLGGLRPDVAHAARTNRRRTTNRAQFRRITPENNAAAALRASSDVALRPYDIEGAEEGVVVREFWELGR